MQIGQIGRVGRMGGAPVTGVPLHITIDGVVYERVSLDGVYLEIDGAPVYMEA